MATPQESGVNENLPWIAALGGIVVLAARRWTVNALSKVNPWKLMQMAAVSLNRPLMQEWVGPIHARLDDGDKRMGRIEDGVERVQRVIDRMPGAAEAHEAVKIEDAAKKRWEEIS